jgi:hypothetical protein
MKTNGTIAAIGVILSLTLAGPLHAAPRGKHIIEPFLHKHGAQSGQKFEMNHTMLKRIGLPGKGMVRHIAK